MPLSADTSLGRYKIISPLGAGGMGEVYRAEDTVLNRQVAIKVLPQHLTNNAEALKRFQKEAKALAALTHSNILTIHDFVSDNGLSFVVMELLEGETLRARMNTSQLSWQKTVEIGVAIAEGLAAAHSKGVVHRDLKPENILLTSKGAVKILDFGLARFKSHQIEEELTNLETISRATESGIVMGTVPYMSPEQVRGERVDERSDIFSFGCVLYEMLSGKRPFSGKTSAEIAASILRDEPKKLNGVPAELERILQHCLEKRPERRLHSAHDLAIELKDLSVSNTKTYPLPSRRKNKAAIIAIVILVAFLSVVVFRQKFIVPSNVEKIQSLAVLPLKNLSGDPKQEYFADGMTEELISKLARISALRVISRTSVMEYKGSQKKSLPEIAKELNVDAIIEGSVMQSGNRVRITAQLIHAPTDKHLWAESYERDLADILSLQNEVASAVAEEIRIKLSPQEKAQLVATPQVMPAAYEAYLRGINYISYWGEKSEQETRLGITMLERSIEIDPNFAKAYAELSMAHSWMYHVPYDHTSERLTKAELAGDQAFRLQPDLPEAHIALGFYHYWGFKDYDKAFQEFSIAQKGLPNDKQLLVGLAAIYKRRGNFEAALQGFKKALQLDPRNASAAGELGIVYNALRKYADAQRYYDLAVSLAPDNSAVYGYKVSNYLQWTGDTKGARAIVMKTPDGNVRNDYLSWLEMLDRNYQAALDLLRLTAGTSYENALDAGYYYRLMKMPDKSRTSYETARLELEKLLRNNPNDEYLHSQISRAYAGLGRKEEAILEAKRAADLYPVSKDAHTGPAFVRNLAIVYVMVGEYEAALDKIEYLLSLPFAGVSGLSVPMLRIDPTWDPLRSHPRFQKILDKYDPLHSTGS
jgi:serine/threonine protein kinase/Flp pilus assembly protein TadD